MDYLLSLFPLPRKKNPGSNKIDIQIGKWRQILVIRMFPFKNQNKVPPEWKIRPRIEHTAFGFHQTLKGKKKQKCSVN